MHPHLGVDLQTTAQHGLTETIVGGLDRDTLFPSSRLHDLEHSFGREVEAKEREEKGEMDNGATKRGQGCD